MITIVKEIPKLNCFSYRKVIRKTVVLFCLFISFGSKGQLVVNGNITNTDIITNLFGPGVVISNLVVNCGAAGANQYGSFTAAGTGLGINSGLLMTNGTIQGAIGPNDTTNISSTCVGTSSSDACITGIATGQQHDPCIITFDITPSCDTLTMNYVFGSEEYPDFVNSFNDAFGFFINGPK
ncbi:MAG TPA: choice-of-anchor L domain-containing protein, partial [Bacteroidia bacterium]|nr:choice-of-anchor L domain-containing protein [Bacteroidia bacterium]